MRDRQNKSYTETLANFGLDPFNYKIETEFVTLRDQKGAMTCHSVGKSQDSS